jgi:hypothetical protein
MPNPTTLPSLSWQGLTDLRISLIDQGRFMEALRFSSTERGAGTALDDYQTTCLLLQLAMDHRAQVANTKDEIPWRIAITGFRLDLGKLFASIGAKAQAEIWLTNLEKEFDETISLVNGSTGTLRVDDSLDMLTIELARLQMVEKEEPTQSRFQKLLILGEKMQAVSHIETEKSHYLAISWAQKLYPPDEAAVIRTDIQFRTQKLFETQGRVPAEITNLNDIMNSTAHSSSEIAKRIEMLQDFDRRHRCITLPTTKRQFLVLLGRLQARAGNRECHDMRIEANALLSNMPSGYNLRREVSNIQANEQTLEVKDILDRKEIDNRELDINFSFFSQPPEVVVPRLLKKLVSEEAASGILTEQALLQLFGSGENNTEFKTEGILELEGQGLLRNLVGTSQFPLPAVEWAKRRPTLRSWLLDGSRAKYNLRECLWVAIHNFRSIVWDSHYMLDSSRKVYAKIQTPKLVGIDFIGKPVKTLAPEWMEVTCEQISAIQERLDLREAKLGSAARSDYFEKEWWTSRSSLSQFYLNLFSCCRIPGEGLSDVSIEFFSRADEIAREQVVHWRSVNNS